jgi:sugar phosphate permease
MAEASNTASSTGRFAFFGWRVVLALALMRLVGGGVGLYGRGVFLLPMEEDLGVGRDSISLVYALTGLQVGLFAPVAGMLAQRYGGRKLLLFGALSSGAGYIVLFWVNSLLALFIVFAALISLGFNWSILQAPTAITNAWFARQKALALSVLSAGIGLGGLLIVPTLAALVRANGWRPTAVVAGIVIIIVGVATASIIRNTPEEKGLTPDGDPVLEQRPGSTPIGDPEGDTSLTARQAFRTPLYWLLLIGVVLWMSTYGSLGLHFIPILVSKGESTQTAAWFAGMYAVSTFPMVLLIGWLSDRFNGLLVLAGFAISLSLAVLVLRLSEAPPGYALAVLLVSPVESVWPVFWAVLGRAYGRRWFDSIRGWIYGMVLLGSAGWSYIPGVVFERTGSYNGWLTALIFLMIATSAVFVLASRFPVRRPSPGVTS